VERDGALFNFAVEYANSHPELPSDWQVDDEVLAEFTAFLAERDKIDEYLEVFELTMSDSLLAANADFMRWGMRREVVRKTNGAQAAYQVAIEEDTQLHEALALFDEADDLAGLLVLAVAWNEEAMAKAAADSAAAAGTETVGVE